MFGDWHLALAAYNWGQGNVQRAMARNRKRRRLPHRTTSSLRMPDETRNYVPKLQAMKNIVARPEAFGAGLPPLENHPYFLSVPIERDIDVALAARLAGLTLEEFQQLNPQLNKPVILAAGTPQVLLPYDNANRFVRGLAAHRGPLASWTAWVAPRTLKPADAARQVGMSEARAARGQPHPGAHAGQGRLDAAGAAQASSPDDVAEHIADRWRAAEPGARSRPARRAAFKAGQGRSVAWRDVSRGGGSPRFKRQPS
jgi:membrane-bound lytic murein transglycosylase D